MTGRRDTGCTGVSARSTAATTHKPAAGAAKSCKTNYSIGLTSNKNYYINIVIISSAIIIRA